MARKPKESGMRECLMCWIETNERWVEDCVHLRVENAAREALVKHLVDFYKAYQARNGA